MFSLTLTRDANSSIRGEMRQPSTHAPLPTNFGAKPDITLWSSLILPMYLTVGIDLICCCPSEIAYPSCMPSASHLIHNRLSCSHGILIRGGSIPGLSTWTAPFLNQHSSTHYFAGFRLTLGYLDDLTLAGP